MPSADASGCRANARCGRFTTSGLIRNRELPFLVDMAFIRPGDSSEGAFGYKFNAGKKGTKHARSEDASTSLYGSSISQQRNELPVAKHRREVLYLIEHHATTVVVGETGSGKTTQLPQYLYHAGWAEGDRQIACTQPRRVAASTVATRVAEEMGVPLGELVGYCVRFDDVTTQVRAAL